MSANIKLSQAQLFQISKSGGRFGIIQQLRELGNFGSSKSLEKSCILIDVATEAVSKK